MRNGDFDLLDPNSGHGVLRPRPDGMRARCMGPARCSACQAEAAAMEKVPGGAGGPLGPTVGRFGDPHVYARDVRSGAGNCVCGSALGELVHTQAAPGVPIPRAIREPFARRVTR